MRSLGVWLTILGVGSFILPMMGYQFRIMKIFGSSMPIVALVMAVVGIGLLVVSSLANRPRVQ